MTELKILSTLALMGAIRKLASRLEEANGQRIKADFAPTNALMNRINSGEIADIAILTAAAVDELTGRGTLVGRIDLALSLVGVAVKAGAPKPFIESTEAVRHALLHAKSIAYSRIGASGIFFADLIERLGIAREVNAKSTIIPSGFTAELAAKGEVELAVQQVSELMIVPGVDIVGPFPPDIQSATVFSAGLFVQSAQHESANGFLRLFSSEEGKAALREAGLDALDEAG